MYTDDMRRMTKPIGLAVCLCLLLVQFSGLHMHVDEEGYVGVPQVSHAHGERIHDYHEASHPDAVADVHHDHGSLAGDDDYAGTKDVSLYDLILSFVKAPLAVLVLAFLFLVFPLSRALINSHVAHPVLSGRYTRWRPPLRAPPRFA